MINNNERRKKEFSIPTSVSLTGALKIRQTINGLIKKKKEEKASLYIHASYMHVRKLSDE